MHLALMWAYIEGILTKGPYPPCLHMADRALLAGYPRIMRILDPEVDLYGMDSAGYNHSSMC